MTPREAGEIEFCEPDWCALFEEQCARWPKLPRYLQEDSAFEEVMRQWRRWHWSPIQVEGKDKKLPASAAQAIIALARLGLMPPRSAWNEQPRDGVTNNYQRDDHCFLQIAGEEWRIEAIEDRQLLLKRMDGEGKMIDLTKAKWDRYLDSATEMLRVKSEYELDKASKNQL